MTCTSVGRKQFYSFSRRHHKAIRCRYYIQKVWELQLCSVFYILLTVHLVMILGKRPTWRKILYNVFISIVYMFRATPCSSSGEPIVSIQPLIYDTLRRWPFRVQVGKFLSGLHMERLSTQSDIYQMLYWYNCFSSWWAQRLLETCRELK